MFHSCHLLFDHFQFTLIHGPWITGSHAVSLFIASNFTSITSHPSVQFSSVQFSCSAVSDSLRPRELQQCFYFGSISSFFLQLVLHWSPVVYWAPTVRVSSSFSVLSFCLFIPFMEFSKQEYWRGLPFPSPLDHVLSDLSTMTCPFWVVLRSMAHCFIELDKAVHVIRLVSFLWLWFSFCLPSDG